MLYWKKNIDQFFLCLKWIPNHSIIQWIDSAPISFTLPPLGMHYQHKISATCMFFHIQEHIYQSVWWRVLHQAVYTGNKDSVEETDVTGDHKLASSPCYHLAWVWSWTEITGDHKLASTPCYHLALVWPWLHLHGCGI